MCGVVKENEQQTTRSGAAEAPQSTGRRKQDLPQVEGALLNTKQGAAKLGICVRAFQERVSKREIACIKIGGAVRFHPDDLAEFIERSRVKAIGWKGGVSK